MSANSASVASTVFLMSAKDDSKSDANLTTPAPIPANGNVNLVVSVFPNAPTFLLNL